MTRQNRLASEASPYLQQHAENPVDWYPWGEEALSRAKAEDKPILLSIGYSACHWCHVMERESFSDPEIAAQMNALYVNVKVDREERPDLDQVYQLVVQMMGRSGGWPLTVFLTPDRKPFFAGTYFPPHDKPGMPGLPRILSAVHDAYVKRRAEVEEQARDVTADIARFDAVRKASGAPDADLLRIAAKKLLVRFDPENGGFGRRPKFPSTMALDVLLRRGALEGDRAALDAVCLTLDKMRQGGIWDQLGGGFHRYSTDERWLVPHFEKMLYDNALLLRLYTDAFRATRQPRYEETARGIAGYLLREMTSPEGGFYAAEDADSEGEEGKFFVFSLEEVREALGGDLALLDVARRAFGVSELGNFERTRKTVLHAPTSPERIAEALGISVSEARERIERAREALLAEREKRVRPFRDEKILASWNGLMIASLADAGRAFKEPGWVEAATRAFARIEGRLLRDGRVGRFLKGGAARAGTAFLDDQAFFAHAALGLYEATGEPRYVEVATALAEEIVRHHWDAAEGGFYFTPDDGERLIARTKDSYDQSVPSGSSMACLTLMRLGEIASSPLQRYAEKQALLLAPIALDNPFGFGHLLGTIHRLVVGSVDVVVVGSRGDARTQALMDTAFEAYLPNRNLVLADPGDPRTFEVARALTEGKTAGDEGPVAFVCRGRTCSAPVSAPEALAALLRSE